MMRKCANPAYFLGAVAIGAIVILSTVDMWIDNLLITSTVLTVLALGMAYSFKNLQND